MAYTYNNLGNLGNIETEQKSLNLSRYSDGTAQVGTPFNAMGWCSYFASIPAMQSPTWKTLPINTPVRIVSQFTVKQNGVAICQMYVSPQGWVRGGLMTGTKVCQDPTALNNGQAGECLYPVAGCTASLANNYNMLAEVDDGS